jgi:hypothetical protein
MANNPNCLSSTPFTGVPMAPDNSSGNLQPIYIGDLLFQDPTSRQARSAVSMAHQGSALLDQETFAGLFAGVALSRGVELAPGEVSFNLNPLPPQIIVGAGGVFLFNCTATQWYPGDLVAIAENTAGNGLLPQQVVKTTTLAAAIGVAVPMPANIGVSATQVAVRIQSRLFGGIGTPQTEPSSSGTV